MKRSYSARSFQFFFVCCPAADWPAAGCCAGSCAADGDGTTPLNRARVLAATIHLLALLSKRAHPTALAAFAGLILAATAARALGKQNSTTTLLQRNSTS